MNDPRDSILTRLRRASAIEPVEKHYDASPAEAGWGHEEKLERFTRRMQTVRAEIHRIEDGHWVGPLQQLCKEKQIRTLLYGPEGPPADYLKNGLEDGEPELVPYEVRIEQWKQRLFFETDAAVTSSVGAIAETGSLILWPTPEEPRTMSLIPPVHFVVLPETAIHATFAEAITVLDWRDRMPTNALLISGPSKSADIEQTLAYGVHGPKELIVLIVGEAKI